MPAGFIDSKERDPTNYSLAEWQQAKLARHDPTALMSMFQECWARSDSDKAFAQVLRARGYWLAQGDRRGHVAVDYRGEVYAISRYVGIRTKAVKERFGDPAKLSSVKQTKAEIAAGMSDMLRKYLKDMELERCRQSMALAFERNQVL